MSAMEPLDQLFYLSVIIGFGALYVAGLVVSHRRKRAEARRTLRRIQRKLGKSNKSTG